MKMRLAILAVLLFASWAAIEAAEPESAKPNILLLVADDLGWADVGWHGGKFKTPVLSSNLPLRGHKNTLYEGGVRVCAFANWPGRLAPRRLTAPLHAADWMPTLTRLAGWRKPPDLQLDGLDVWPLLTGEVQKPATRTIYIPHPSGAIVLRDGWKLISRKAARKKGPSVELFNVIDDPFEKRDLARAEPQRVKELQALLAALQADDLKKIPKGAGDGVVDKADL